MNTAEMHALERSLDADRCRKVRGEERRVTNIDT